MDEYIHIGKVDGIDYEVKGKDVSNRILGKIYHEDNDPIMVELVAWYEQKQRIADAYKNLADTDYVACKIAEGAATREEYAEIIAQRQAWRDEINRLEAE